MALKCVISGTVSRHIESCRMAAFSDSILFCIDGKLFYETKLQRPSGKLAILPQAPHQTAAASPVSSANKGFGDLKAEVVLSITVALRLYERANKAHG